MSAGLGIFIMGLGATCGVLSTMYPGRNNILIHWTPENILESSRYYIPYFLFVWIMLVVISNVVVFTVFYFKYVVMTFSELYLTLHQVSEKGL